jgi:hypothetical protein
MSVYDPEAANLSAWGALVEKQSKGLTPGGLYLAHPGRYSPENPLYRRRS